MLGVQHFVHLPDKTNGFKIFVATMNIRNPFAFLARIVEVQHRGDRIHADTVGMVFLYPEKTTADEKIPDEFAAVVVYERVPVRMPAAARIGMLEQGCAIESGQGMFVRGKVGGHPIQDDTNA